MQKNYHIYIKLTKKMKNFLFKIWAKIFGKTERIGPVIEIAEKVTPSAEKIESIIIENISICKCKCSNPECKCDANCKCTNCKCQCSENCKCKKPKKVKKAPAKTQAKNKKK